LFGIFFLQIAVGIWFPGRASVRQRELVASPAVQLMLPLLKWLSPIAVVSIFLQLVVGSLQILVVWLGA
jgi:hypothetical protein